ncbi:D-2-hydroxyacid dehydrogenase [Actinomarinicola tropica]|uniref:D-2-hydroxyacid dehydrogenase n=1 Tax=Actinomarinicola tropica TaxID=2789776 RepID=A0A5Q2REN7_9ACTN|nr:D-2-hydroxyacid dehydrogenase [Actinomarinicola tropica]QGG95269.1 D-2-hydroxyacid dehydrogenase [Actinomarinicola tropica]
MDVFLTAAARSLHRSVLDEAAPSARWLCLGDDGTLRDESSGEELDIRTATPEVAWMTTDLVDGGPMRPFFGLVTRSSSLRWLQSSAAGFDAPVFGELVRRGVRLTASHIAGPPIADFVLRAALDHLQDADAWRAAAARHEWDPHELVEMGSTRWLVIGLGTIGREVAVRARAFGAHVTGVRRSPVGDEPVDAMARPDEVPGLLPESHVVVLATPANAGTVHLVDEDFLRHMRADAVLVNVGRGALVDEGALLPALDEGQLARAVLDVTETEPLPADDPLWDHPKVVVTPHSSALGDGRRRRAAEAFVENVRRYVGGEPLLHEVTVDDIDA